MFRALLFGALAFMAAGAETARAATLIYSNDLLGELEPCGCRNNPLGGMARKANLLKKQKGELLQLDAGDLLFDTNTIPPALARQAEIQAIYLLKAMDKLKHDAVVPGEKDFALGVKVFDRLRKRSRVKFLAANLLKGKAHYLQASQIFRKDGLRIGVLGLVGTDLAWPKELRAVNPIAEAKKRVPQLRKNVDVLIVLTHQGYEEDRKLAEAVPGIDLIVGGHTQTFLQEPPTVGATRIYQSSFRNQYVGVLPLSKTFKGENHQLIGLDPNFDSEKTPILPKGSMDELVAQFKAAIAELNTKEDLRLASANHATPSSVKFQTFPRCAECHLKQFDFWRKTQHAHALTPLLEKDQARNKACLQCHTVGLGDPSGFQNVVRLAERRPLAPADDSPTGEVSPTPMELADLAAYLKQVHEAPSLKSEVKLSRLENEPNHTVQQSLSHLVKSWAPVQCENCHQPGKDHPFQGTYAKSVAKETCLNCHTAERAPEWYKSGQPDWEKIAVKRVSITCPAGELTEE